MRLAPVKLFALTLALAGAVTVLCDCRPAAPDDLDPRTPPGAEAPSQPPSPAYLLAVAKVLVAQDAAAGRRSLPEAAALFRELDRRPPGPFPGPPPGPRF
jgi:hypothetical protein